MDWIFHNMRLCFIIILLAAVLLLKLSTPLIVKIWGISSDRKLRKRAERGDAEAQLLWGNYLVSKGECPQGIVWLRKAMEAGNLSAKACIAALMIEGKGISQDVEGGMVMLREVVEKNNPIGQYMLASFYSEGYGVEKNAEEELRLLRLAAEQNLAEAQYDLGMCYLEGKGVPRDTDTAISYLRRAAENPDPDMRAVELLDELGVSYTPPWE